MISYMEVNAIFCTRMDFNFISDVIRFCGNQKYQKHVHRDDIQDASGPSTAIFDLFLLK